MVANGPRETCELHVFRLHEHGLWATMQHDTLMGGSCAAARRAARGAGTLRRSRLPEPERELLADLVDQLRERARSPPPTTRASGGCSRPPTTRTPSATASTSSSSATSCSSGGWPPWPRSRRPSTADELDEDGAHRLAHGAQRPPARARHPPRRLRGRRRGRPRTTPTRPRTAVYDYLGVLLGEVVDALAERPPAADGTRDVRLAGVAASVCAPTHNGDRAPIV